MTDRERHRLELIEFLSTIQRPDYALTAIDEESGLVESGLIDSLALLQIVTYLERTYGVDFSERGIDPEDLRSVNSILDFIARASVS